MVVAMNPAVGGANLLQQVNVQAPQQQQPAAGGGLREAINNGLHRLGQRFSDTMARICHTGQYSRAAVFARENPYVAALSEPAPGENGIVDGGILARNNGAVMARMEAYRQACGSKITSEQMRALINTGEHLVNAITRGQVEGGRIHLTVRGQHYEIHSSLHTTRAISWYLMAKAAEQEVQMGGHHLVLEGSMVMQDPGNRLYNFLNAAPTSYGRVSTHFNERSASPSANGSNVGFTGLFSNRPAQRGIEDFQDMLPSKKGALCFDRLTGNPPQLFLKFESAGMPTVFRLSGHGEAHETIGQKIANAFRSLGRCFQHTLNFLRTRGDHGEANAALVHKEHVVKGEPKGVVWQPYANLLSMIDTSAPGMREWVADLEKLGKNLGISFIEDALANLAHPDSPLRPKPGQEAAFQAQLAGLRTSLQEYHRGLGNDMGVERKGKETHISLETYPREIYGRDNNDALMVDQGDPVPIYED